jgi:hypothetical protein
MLSFSLNKEHDAVKRVVVVVVVVVVVCVFLDSPPL